MNAIKSTIAAIAVKARQTEIRELPVPELGPGAGLLKIEGTGICGSDWTMYLNEKPGPRILGHEMIGTVVALGEAAQARWGVKEGDRVALEEYLPCGFCEDCRIGEYRSCAATEQRITGGIRYGSTALSSWPGLWGGYSQYLYLHPRTVFHKVPENVPLRIASMALPIGNGFQWAVLDGHAGPGKTIVIQGPGQQGLGCVLAAKSAGASMIVVSGLKRDEHRFKVARAFGAHHTVAVDEENLQFALMRLTGGRMADIVIECSGGGPALVNASLGLLRKRGTLLVATRKGNIPEFDNDQLVTKQITYRGVRGHSYQAVELALRTMAEGNFPLESMSTHVVGLEGLDGALKMVGGEGAEPSIHITVDPWK